MQDFTDSADAHAPATPEFVVDGLRASACDVVATNPVAQGFELHFGVKEPRGDDAALVGTRAAHRVHLDRAAAVHLEEVLTRVLGVSPRSDSRPGQPT